MNTINQATLPAIGAALQGGFYAGQFTLDGELYGLIVSPREGGDLADIAWGERGQDIPGARSCNDGHTNTIAMAEAASALANQIRALTLGGRSDWYLPSRDELELIYRNLKPTDEENWCSFRDGDNPSSAPVGYPYTKESPAQTANTAFVTGGAEALEPCAYWASTQCSPGGAWHQGFDAGYQYGVHKGYELRARAVRRFKVTP